ncbi:hypothetical protein BX659_14713 [Orenia metallireducens]|jgi:hypothetical protein|uniref:Uncharacterized protein n=1 Tax=Orenia metallireducens TaxID=1413210 RepID=A0A285IGY7_9FIRM|nr:hypothetical protein BX659_14713 [Orenia metallireducens]SNY47229.1 hypothetical protein SAMN06265827_14813 [Orenia metallireducens]
MLNKLKGEGIEIMLLIVSLTVNSLLLGSSEIFLVL